MVESVVRELVAAGVLDDERFARLFSEDKRELRGWGPERIAAALAERGIEPELIERYCGGEAHGEQVRRGRELLEGRAQPLDDDRARARAIGYLTRRGFPYEVAYEAIREADR